MRFTFEADATMWDQILQDLEEIRGRLLEFAESDAGHTPRADTSATIAAGLLLNATLALQGAVDYECTLAQPPEDIKGRPIGKDGAMVHKCYHGPSQNEGPHCWNGSWDPIDCHEETI